MPCFFDQTSWLLFFHYMFFVWLLFEGGYYLRAATIRGQRLFRSELLIVRLLFEGVFFILLRAPIVQLLFEGGVYLKKYGTYSFFMMAVFCSLPQYSWPVFSTLYVHCLVVTVVLKQQMSSSLFNPHFSA